MPDEKRRTRDDEPFEVPEDESERGIAEDEDEDDFEDTDELDEDEEEEEDDDLGSEKAIAEDRGFTAEIGSEGGSPGDIETELRKPRAMRGSEATTTAATDERPGFDDRHAGGGVERRRR